MALPDWNADMQAGKQIAKPKWSPCSPSETELAKVRKTIGDALRPQQVGATIADSAEAATFTPKW